MIIKDNNEKINKISPRFSGKSNQEIINYILDDNKNYYSICTNFNYSLLDFFQRFIQKNFRNEEINYEL